MPTERVKLIDFGFARVINSSLGTTLSGGVGTVRFTAPELLTKRNAKANRLCDIYSLGATTYEMLTGLPAFIGQSDAFSPGLRQPPSVRKVEPTIPELVNELIRRALDNSPSRRPQSARDFYNEFMRGIKGIEDSPTSGKMFKPEVYDSRSWDERFLTFAKLNSNANFFLVILYVLWQLSAFVLLIALLAGEERTLPYAWIFWILVSLVPIAILFNRKITLLETLTFYGKNLISLLVILSGVWIIISILIVVRDAIRAILEFFSRRD